MSKFLEEYKNVRIKITSSNVNECLDLLNKLGYVSENNAKVCFGNEYAYGCYDIISKPVFKDGHLSARNWNTLTIENLRNYV